MSSMNTRSVTILCPAIVKPESEGKVHNTDLRLEELKDPSVKCHSLALGSRGWGGRTYSEIWGWKSFQTLALLVDFYDLCYSKGGPEKPVLQLPPSPEDLSS